MANFQISNVRIKIKHDTATNWTASTLIPFEGEWCLDTTNNIIKIGDGTHTFANLPGIRVGESDKLSTARTIIFEAQAADNTDPENPISAIPTDVTGRLTFDGSQDITTQLTLINITRTDATADNTATNIITGITSDTKGRITATSKMEAVSTYTGNIDIGKLVKLNSDGKIDTNFVTNGADLVTNDKINAELLTDTLTGSATDESTDTTTNTEVNMASKVETYDENNNLINTEYSSSYVLNSLNI